MKAVLLIFLTICSIFSYSQELKGVVFDEKNEPLPGAVIRWQETTNATSSDDNGEFEISRSAEENTLIISFVGFKADTVKVEKATKSLKVQLRSSLLNEVVVEVEQFSSYIDYANVRQTEIVSERELRKAACCNLSESFETNASVDVSISDAVTGTRQIQMLGLAGKYTQITRELIPNVRGLTSNYGLTYIPGTWIQSIQITKGIGSVANGYESISGQINTEFQKPYDKTPKEDKVFFNLYGNGSGRTETNLNYGMKVSDKFSNTTLLHASTRPFAIDNNGDGFMDNPTGRQLNLLHRWKYFNGSHMAQMGINALIDSKQGGQLSFDPEKDKLTTNRYGIGIDSKRFELWGKTGYVFDGDPERSVGFQTSLSHYDNTSYFGLTTYDASQLTYYANGIYQTELFGSDHQLKSGVSFLFDRYDEAINDTTFHREEVVPGVFSEYTYMPSEKFSIVAGVRADYHNIIGLMINPRLHGKYHPTENSTVRITAGRGQRIANIFAENTSMFATSRAIRITPSNATTGMYGLDAETAWNYGLSFSKEFKVNYHRGAITADVYRTDFENQVIADWYQNQYEVHFYNLDGASFSNSAQLELTYSPFKRADLKTAYRYYDVKTKYEDGLFNVPFISTHRGFLNMSYETRNGWTFDATGVLTGPKSVPGKVDGELTGVPTESPWYFTANAQVGKLWEKQKFEVYVGSENITNFRQSNPIVGADEPFGSRFDASLIWGPIFGRNVYAGLKWKF